MTALAPQRFDLRDQLLNVHDDDVHALCKIERSGRTFLISGSKDCTVRSHEWTESGRKPAGRILAEPRERKYQCWITALDAFSDGSWVAASRNGFLRCCDLTARKSYYIGFPFSPTSTHAYAYKDRNQNRIMSVFCLNKRSDLTQFHCLIGYPESFCQFDLTTQRVVRTFNFHASQWVYGFCPIRPTLIAVIHGTNLSVLSETGESWEIATRLVQGARVPSGTQVPFISSIFPMLDVSAVVSTVALSYFGGRTEVRDVERGRIIHSAHEHTGRVWQSLPFIPNCYASCADDQTIKIWDIRLPESVSTSDRHPGRVSALCFLSSSSFVAASCPDDLASTTERAAFYHYDLRALATPLSPPTPIAEREATPAPA